MFKKIITYFIILAVVLPIFATVLPFGGGVKTAYAAGDGNQIYDPCDLQVGTAGLRVLGGVVTEVLDAVGVTGPPDVSVWNCVTFTFAHFLYGVVMQGAIVVAGWASSLFNLSIQFSLTGDVFDAGKNIMIKDGWAMVRDLFNLVFIFILLYAAISTILQYGSMDIKKILPGLIVAALLVNFSLMISKVVIDASHVFSWEFYNQIDATDGGKYPELMNDININNGNFQKKNLANVFLAGFNPQSVLTGQIKTLKSIGKDGVEIITEVNDESQWQKIVAHALKNKEKFPSTIGRMIVIILLETALAIFSAFILFAGAIMFIFRVVLLWMIMIFSPIAFLGMILPGMNKYSKMWWDYLMNQAFFAPAFLFMFMLSTKFINSKMVYGLLKIEQNGDSALATGIDGGSITSVLLHFTIVAILMGGSLYVAKQMGGKSAELGMAWAHKGKNKLLSPGWMLNNRLSNNRLSRYLYGAGADKILKGEGRVSGILKAIPGASIGFRKLGAMKKADEDKARKAAEKYAGTLSSAGRKSLDIDKGRGFFGRAVYGGGVTEAVREGYEKIIEKKKAEGEERGRIAEKILDLMGSHFDKFAGGLNRENAKKKVEGILLRGNTEELDKWTEAEDRAVEKEHNEAIDKINEMKRDFDNKIKEINDNLTKARSNGDNTDELMKKLKKEEDKAYENNKKLAEIITKGKHRENLQKGVDKYEGKQSFKSEKPESKKEDKAKIK